MKQLQAAVARTRKGLSLIEIMVSILVLSIGLLGVLAAIPYGGFQLARMRNANYSSTLARNAFNSIEANKWYMPRSASIPNTSGYWNFFNWGTGDTSAANNVTSVVTGANSLVYNSGAFAWTSYQSATNNLVWTNNVPLLWGPSDGSAHYIDLTYPIMLDPVGFTPTREFRDSRDWTYCAKYWFPAGWNGTDWNHRTPKPYTVTAPLGTGATQRPLYRMVWPEIPNSAPEKYAFAFPAAVSYFFYSHDDLAYGIPERNKGADVRPEMGLEVTSTLTGTSSNNALLFKDLYPYMYTPLSSGVRGSLEQSVPAVATKNVWEGQFSWMAMMQPQPASDPFYASNVMNIHKVDIDVVIFKGRTPVETRGVTPLVAGDSASVNSHEPVICDVTPVSGGYYGGMFDITPQLAGVSQSVLMEELQTTSHLLLIGDEDLPVPSADGTRWVYRKFARWYKIVYFKHNPDADSFTIRVNLSGSTCPTRWWYTAADYTNVNNQVPAAWPDHPNHSGNDKVPIHSQSIKAVIFPNVIDVYSKTVSTSD